MFFGIALKKNVFAKTLECPPFGGVKNEFSFKIRPGKGKAEVFTRILWARP
jgi:hypothetical protein